MWRLAVLVLVATASAQLPSLGWCPEYQPMANFNINRFLGNWFEAERYFTVSDIGTRCVNTKYEATPEGRIIVSNEITNSLTGLKRVLDGTLQMIGREGEGRLMVKYASLPVPYDNEFSILGTDYDNYAVMWSCSGIGPVHIQNAWILTRDRLATPAITQAAYGVLDRFKLSRTFFVKTNQADCNILPQPAAEPMMKSEEIEAKNAPVTVPEAEVEVEQPVVKKADPEIKSEMNDKPTIPEVLPETKSAEVPEIKSTEVLKQAKLEMPEELTSNNVEVMAKKEEPMEKKEEIMEKKEEMMDKKEDMMDKKEDMAMKSEQKLDMPLQ